MVRRLPGDRAPVVGAAGAGASRGSESTRVSRLNHRLVARVRMRGCVKTAEPGKETVREMRRVAILATVSKTAACGLASCTQDTEPQAAGLVRNLPLRLGTL